MITKETIRKRKSIRKFDMTPLDTATLEMVKTHFANLSPLYPNIDYTIEIAGKTKGMFNIKAPHYLIFNSEEKEGYLENIGFIGQQLDLFLSASGLGSCWLGAAKPMSKEESALSDKEEPVPSDTSDKKRSTLSHIICIAFGNPAESLHRELSGFKRKPLSDVSEGNDERLEAARLAPSGMNAQNWYFIAEGGKIHCYVKKPNPLLGLMLGKMSSIDLGIAICHIAQESESFSFTKDESAPIRKGLIYAGTAQ